MITKQHQKMVIPAAAASNFPAINSAFNPVLNADRKKPKHKEGPTTIKYSEQRIMQQFQTRFQSSRMKKNFLH